MFSAKSSMTYCGIYRNFLIFLNLLDYNGYIRLKSAMFLNINQKEELDIGEVGI